jgi:hypothetical protein
LATLGVIVGSVRRVSPSLVPPWRSRRLTEGRVRQFCFVCLGRCLSGDST